ncbi:MAG: PIG-L deacetylase family protein [Candidatus Heimdallarchaeaceae archaeon]
MNIAFIFAHPDDESLSTGGTIARYTHEGSNVSTLCLTSTKLRKEEYLQAMNILEVKNPRIFDFDGVVSNYQAIKEEIIQFILEFKPEIVVTHLEEDYHIDHRTTFEIVKEAIEWSAHVTQYENAHLVSKLYTTETTVLIPSPDVLVDISPFYEIKERAIRCYTSQLSKGGKDFYLEFHKYRTMMRGTQASVKYAEAFKAITLKKNSPFYKIRNSLL